MNAGQPFRLDNGGRIDRSKPIEFEFNGRACEGYVGDTLASALLANGVKVVARSFKYHRPRGILSAGVEETNALLSIDLGFGWVPNVRATLMPLMQGLRAKSQNCFPSVNFDLARILDYTRALWPAGFYNKTFIWPNWHAYEWAMRRLAGLGRLPDGSDPARYRHSNAHCDVLVVGAGPYGLRSALDAARQGLDVLILEQDTEPGGSLLYDHREKHEWFSLAWLTRAVDELESMPNVRLMLRATVAGYYDHNVLTIHDCSAAFRGAESVQTLWKVRARRVVLATGAIEQPLLFGNNDLPGIMLAGAMHQYASRYGVRCGNRVAAIVNNASAWRSLFALHDLGVEIVAIIDSRDDVANDRWAGARARGITVHAASVALKARGSRTVRALDVLDSNGSKRVVECDSVAMSGGLNPTAHLFAQAGGKLRYDQRRACFVPATSGQQIDVVGAVSGEPGECNEISARRRAPVSGNRQWVDFLHDVTVSDIDLAVCENYVSVEHLKRYTTVGMAVDQGKTSNLNALTLLGQLTGKEPSQLGTTSFRPNFMPVTIGAVAGNRRGDLYAPSRLLPADDWHRQHGAVFEDYARWRRPAYYGADRSYCIELEARQVRESAGLFDASPLGKIEVKGPDAARFLNFFYVNSVPTLQPGRARYGLMLNENGVVMDDGVFVRLAEDHFLVNTTSGGADRIAAWFEEWRQCEFPDLQVLTSNVTSQWAVATLAGPQSRAILSNLLGDADLSTERLPHMSCISGSFADGTAYRIQRVSFTGELSYEINVPAGKSVELFARLMTAGETHALQPFGIEALMMLRTEKGFLHVGVDTDGTTNAFDIGLGKLVARKTVDFIGARSLMRAEDRKTGRRQLIGFELEGNGATVLAGAHFVRRVAHVRRSEGFVTSVCRSPTLGKTVGLGLLERGFERSGELIDIFDAGRIVTGRVVGACFYDPDGERVRA